LLKKEIKEMQSTGSVLSNPILPMRGGGGSTETESSIFDKPVPKARVEVSESAFLFLFSEVVQYCQTHSQTPEEFKDRLSGMGRSMGIRYAELLAFRNARVQRFTDLTDALKYVSSTVWKSLFGKDADGLEKVTASQATYYIADDSLLVNKYVAKEASATCAAYVAGIVQGVLDAGAFKVKVTPVRYATDANNTATAKNYIKVQAVDDDEQEL